MHRVQLSIFSALLASVGLAQAAPLHNAETPSSVEYRVFLSPFEVKRFGEQLRVDKQTYFPKRIGRVDTAGHYGEVAYAVEAIAERYGVTVLAMTSGIALSFTAQLNEQQASLIAKDSGVTGVEKIARVHNVYSATSTAGDFINGSEVTSWAKIYVNANQAANVITPFYLIDGHLNDYGQYDLNVVEAPQALGAGNADHAAHVAGIIGGRQNGSGVVGINPSQQIKLFGLGWDNSQNAIFGKFDEAVRNAEFSNQFAVANLSLNTDPKDLINSFDYSRQLGRVIRVASNRLFITQSAGNADQDACHFSYSYPGSGGRSYRANDGVMVVGGVNRNGGRFSGAVNDWGGGATANEGGSNYGPCVEAWAPAHEITSVVYNTHGGANATRVLSGTSFAAPIVSAIAARYGSISTRPIERETYIRNSLINTGSQSYGFPIRVVKYTDPASHNIPKRLDIATSSSPTNPTNLHTLYDGKFFDPTAWWSAGANNGSILFDLGSLRNVVGIRIAVHTDASPVEGQNLEMGFAIGVGSSPSTIVETAYHTEPSQINNAPVYIDIPSTSARYVRLNASNPHSPLGFSEVEIYGY